LKDLNSKFKRIARTLELDDETGDSVVKYLFDLNSKINIPHNLSAIGVKEEHIETLADLAIADFAHPNNPKPVTREDFRTLYRKAL
jgi:alcohol dehydrogenase class IV